MVVWIFEWLSRHFVRWMFRSGAFIKSVARVCRKRYRFRHTLATDLMKAPERNIHLTKCLLNHSNIQTTMSYIEADYDHMRAVLHARSLAQGALENVRKVDYSGSPQASAKPKPLSITGTKQGLITAGAFTEDSVGNTYQEGHEDQVMVQGFNHEVIIPRDPQSGQPTGQRVHKPVVITKVFDKASPLLLAALTTNAGFSVTSMTFRTPGAPLRSASLQVTAVRLDTAQIVTTTADANGKLNGAVIKGSVDIVTGIVRLRFTSNLEDTTGASDTTNAGFSVTSMTFRTPGAPLRSASLQVTAVRLDTAQIVTTTADANGKLNGAVVKGSVDIVTGIVRLRFTSNLEDTTGASDTDTAGTTKDSMALRASRRSSVWLPVLNSSTETRGSAGARVTMA